MTRMFPPSILALCALAAAGRADAQALYNQPTSGAYGGGFIELLMTGRDPTPGAARHGYAVAPRAFAVEPQSRPGPQVAGLPSAPDGFDESRIGRAIDPKYRRQMVAWRGP